jgi:hypothetical protein
MEPTQEHEMIKALQDIAYELKRIADAIYEERESNRGPSTEGTPPLDRYPSRRRRS